MLKRLAKFLIITALASSIGLHWAFLQSVAWTSMLASNLRTTSFSQAVELTFDGKHPCRLCKAIANQKRSERKADSNPQLKKLEFPPACALAATAAPAAYPLVPGEDFRALLLFARPPTPPPRSLPA